jgi:transposase
VATLQPRRAFKQELPVRFHEARQQDPGVLVELWTMDEHRVGLIPILRVVWAKRGHRPVVAARPRYEWLYLAGFVHPESGRTSWWIVPTINAQVFSAILEAFAEEQQVGPGKRILLMLDGAGWHTGSEVQCPEGIELVSMPPYSPELQPAEHLWELCDEPLVNKNFKSLAELTSTLGERCCQLTEQTQIIRSTTLFHWWPTTQDTVTV